ncbi:hypothetical protein F4775DRAFT_589699 [Biscogniauxia sp. FL1348]|nr:hypothetical protein F4775DRAFT_589699 [Biscogniauxia sp. FL1348]
MKWILNLLSIGLVATSVVAAPLERRQDGDGGIELFHLKITSNNPDLDGKYLAMNGEDLGIFAGDDTSPVKVYQTNSSKEGLKELHTYPVGIVDHSLGLKGPPGLMTFVDMISPGTADPGEGQVATWDTFRMDEGKVTNNGEGEWLAFPKQDQSWQVKWSDGTSVITADYMTVEISYEDAGEGRFNS